MNKFPQNIIDLGVTISSGEFAWKKDDIEIVLNELKKYDISIIGGEVWALEIEISSNIPKLATTINNVSVIGILPMKDGSSSVEHWDIDMVENWEEFKQKSFNETLPLIISIDKDIKERILDAYKNHIYYCLTFYGREDFLNKESKTTSIIL